MHNEPNKQNNMKQALEFFEEGRVLFGTDTPMDMATPGGFHATSLLSVEGCGKSVREGFGFIDALGLSRAGNWGQSHVGVLVLTTTTLNDNGDRRPSGAAASGAVRQF